MEKAMSPTADKISDPISQKALQDMMEAVFKKNFAPWTPTERERALLKVATGLEMAAQGIRDLLKSEHLQV
jgi:hypothetical protein